MSLFIPTRVYEQERLQPDAILDSIGPGDAALKLKQVKSGDDLLATDGQAPGGRTGEFDPARRRQRAAASGINFQAVSRNLVVRYRIVGAATPSHSRVSGSSDASEELLSGQPLSGCQVAIMEHYTFLHPA